MSKNFPSWLTRQMVRKIKGANLDAYLLALEGWRRGLCLKWYLDLSNVTDLTINEIEPLGNSFSLSSTTKKHFFHRSRGDKVANDAMAIGMNRRKAKEKLCKSRVPVPEGKSFNSRATVEEIVGYGLMLGFPLVVKPTICTLGVGSSTNITTENKLRESVEHIRKIGCEEVIVERHIHGDSYSLYVIGEKVVGATQQKPANIIGDGINDIENLIAKKNEQRRKNPYLKTKLIEIDEGLKLFIRKGNYTLKSIPAKDERVYLNKIANISAGGDPLEKMDMLTPQIKETAVNALKSIPGLNHGGIDILICDNGCTVINVDPTADISMHAFPIIGKPVNISKFIIDYYFSETISSKKQRVYFNYEKISRLINQGTVQEFLVSNAPANILYAKRYIVSGKVQKVGYRRVIK